MTTEQQIETFSPSRCVDPDAADCIIVSGPAVVELFRLAQSVVPPTDSTIAYGVRGDHVSDKAGHLGHAYGREWSLTRPEGLDAE